MHNTAPVKYPSSYGEIDRVWLVNQIAEAKYPNALLELALHPYPSGTLCDYARVTCDVLIEFVLGKDSLECRELVGLCMGLNNHGRTSVDLMMDEIARVCTDANAIQSAQEAVRDVMNRRGHEALYLIRDMLNWGKVPEVAVENAHRFVDWANFWDGVGKTERNYRSTRLVEEVQEG